MKQSGKLGFLLSEGAEMSADHPYLQQARRDLDRAEANRAKAETALRAAEHDIHRLQIFIEQYELYSGESSKVQYTNKYKSRNRSIADAAIEVISNSSEPLHIQEILDALIIQGIDFGGDNKAANLAAYLSKDNRVKFERRIGWMLVDSEDSGAQNFVRQAGSVGSSRNTSSRSSAEQRAEGSPSAPNTGTRRSPLPNYDLDEDIPF